MFQNKTIGDRAVAFALALAAGFLAIFLSTDVRAQAGDRYAVPQISGGASLGLVMSAREVAVEATSSTRTQGAALGAALGGLAARNSQSWQRTALIATLAGIGGNMAAENLGRSRAQEIVIALMGRDGKFDLQRLQVIVQPEPSTPVREGQTVVVMNQGSQWRVIAAGPMFGGGGESFVPQPTQQPPQYTPWERQGHFNNQQWLLN